MRSPKWSQPAVVRPKLELVPSQRVTRCIYQVPLPLRACIYGAVYGRDIAATSKAKESLNEC